MKWKSRYNVKQMQTLEALQLIAALIAMTQANNHKSKTISLATPQWSARIGSINAQRNKPE